MRQNKWVICIKRRGENLYDLSDFQVMEPPEGTYWADPFIQDKYCFFEWYDYDKGRLAVADIVETDGKISLENPRVIIDEEKHLSFPSVVTDGMNYYMTPERVLAGELLVYRAVECPDVWAVHSRVAVGRYDDPVLEPIAGGFNLWCTDDNKLRVFQSTDNMRTWRVIKTEDKPYQRSAGRIFYPHWGHMIRPTQDSVPIYGRAIKFLDGEGKIAHTIEPDFMPGITGVHTFNFNSQYVVWDARIPL